MTRKKEGEESQVREGDAERQEERKRKRKKDRMREKAPAKKETSNQSHGRLTKWLFSLNKTDTGVRLAMHSKKYTIHETGKK